MKERSSRVIRMRRRQAADALALVLRLAAQAELECEELCVAPGKVQRARNVMEALHRELCLGAGDATPLAVRLDPNLGTPGVRLADLLDDDRRKDFP